MCSKGFTLAETLITLGIIGVVAAITLPTLIGKYQKIIFVTRMKQTYTIVANAFITSKSNNGDPTEWYFGSEFSNENIKNNLLITIFKQNFRRVYIWWRLLYKT